MPKPKEQEQIMGDSPAGTTQAAPESKSPRVMQVGDTFPWAYRDTDPETGKARETTTTATIARCSVDVVWCDLTPANPSDEQAKAMQWPRRVHVLRKDAAKALGLPWPEPAAGQPAPAEPTPTE